MTNKERLRDEARKIIISQLKENPKLLIFIKSTAPSGMSRKMKVLIGDRDMTYYINDLLGYKQPPMDKGDYIKVSGCGMNMSFWLANAITFELWPYQYAPFKDGQVIREKQYSHGAPSIKFIRNAGTCLDWQVIY